MDLRETTLTNFGRSLRSSCLLARPLALEQVAEIFALARKDGRTIALRGAGLSYSAAAINTDGIVLDLTGLARILEWDPATGVVTAEPGVTLRSVWQRVLPDGWWPPVVSGTMFTTLGGCLASNIHGKNNFRLGTIGEHVLRFTAMFPNGKVLTCSPAANAEYFNAMISGMGLLGVFTSVTLQMKRVHSGRLKVRAWPARDLAEHLETLADGAVEHDYAVGWLDATASGAALGRGQLHAADQFADGEDPEARPTLSVQAQELPQNLFGLLPRSAVHYLMRPFVFDLGMRFLNGAKYLAGKRESSYPQTHAAFHFLLDYVPRWEQAYGPGGLVQYQSFLPKETAADTWREMLGISHARGLPSYLAVTKRHRPDRFLISYSVDGYSLALDFKVTRSNQGGLRLMFQDFDRIVLQAGGRLYLAKNRFFDPHVLAQALGAGQLAEFRKLKSQADPDGLLCSDLGRTLLAHSGSQFG